MRLYGAIQKIEPQDDGTVRVHGIATSEAVDDQGEIVRAEAMRAAIPDYMRFPALREMHQLSAAGTTLEAEVCENGATRIVAHVVDPVAVAKVKNQVYRGFSIGGRVTQREPTNPKAITSLVLNEISLVDRPANPEAIFDCWKAAAVSSADVDGADLSDTLPIALQAPLVQGPLTSPIQMWACEVPDHRHLTKVEAVKCLEKCAFQPTETEIAGRPLATTTTTQRHEEVAGTTSAADAAERRKAAHAALIKAQWDLAEVARVIVDLNRLKDALGFEATTENDNSPQPAQLREMIMELCEFLSALAGGEMSESSSETVGDGSPVSPGKPGRLAMVSGGIETARIAALRENEKPKIQVVAPDFIAKARNSLEDQVLVDMATLACDNCIGTGGFSAAEQEHIRKARGHLRRAAAGAADGSTSEAPARSARPSGADRADTASILDLIVTTLGERGRGYWNMMDVAHECLRRLADGAVCGETANGSACHSGEAMADFDAAHLHLVAAGVHCKAAAGNDCGAPVAEQQANEFEPGKNERALGLEKVLAGERIEKAVLIKTLEKIVPMLEQLTKRVDDIARTPLPPLTIAKGTVSISKQQDRGSTNGSDPKLSPEAITSALAKMSKEEQTLTLIKASYANPIRLVGPAEDER